MALERSTYITRCGTCGAKAPRLGDGGSFGVPSASARLRGDLDTPTFGSIYAGFAAVGLITPAMDRFLAFLKAHRKHKLEQICSEPQLSGFEPPWAARLEPRLTDDILNTYKSAYYGAECTLCNKRWVSQQRDRLRRFRPGLVGKERIKKFVEQAYCENSSDSSTAAPLSPDDVYRLGLFLNWKHRGHPIRICLLSDDEARKAFLAPRRRRGRATRRPKPPNTAEAWWTAIGQSGWLSEVPKREATRIRRAIPEQASTRTFLALAPSGFDSESIENDGDYRRVLRAYEAASCGVFRPTKVRDRLNRSKETVSISFQVGAKKFSRTFPQSDDYVTDGLEEFMNEVLGSLGTKRRFHTLPTGDQSVALVCVTPETFSRAQMLGLIPFGQG